VVRSSVADDPAWPIVDLADGDRERAVPVLIDSFTGIYRWHAKRTLREVDRVRAVVRGDDVVALTMLEPLVVDVGYVYYVAVASSERGRGLGGRLLDDALSIFQEDDRAVAYVATEEENEPMVRALARRGFREVERAELGWADGGLGAWGLRSRMTLVSGEILMGRRLRPQRAGDSPPSRQ
jgi:ribosomal protein S18 acetylase RimI-like enzyme